VAVSGEGTPPPGGLFAAAWEAATGVVAEWAEQTVAVARESLHKLAHDPAVRAVLASWRTSFVWTRQDCGCSCTRSHPDDMGVCDNRAVITRRLHGDVDVPLCAPCAVAQGVAELAQ